MIILGVDFGEARTGLAICDRSELLASPVGTIAETDFDTCVEKVAAAAKERRAACIVVGYPKNMNGTIGERAERCQQFAACLKEKTNLPTVLWDERSTTVTAHQYLNQTNTRGKKRKAVVDTVAATIILESYPCVSQTPSGGLFRTLTNRYRPEHSQRLSSPCLRSSEYHASGEMWLWKANSKPFQRLFQRQRPVQQISDSYKLPPLLRNWK